MRSVIRLRVVFGVALIVDHSAHLGLFTVTVSLMILGASGFRYPVIDHLCILSIRFAWVRGVWCCAHSPITSVISSHLPTIISYYTHFFINYCRGVVAFCVFGDGYQYGANVRYEVSSLLD